MAEKPAKSNIQGGKIKLAKLNYNWLKADRASFGRILKGGGSALPMDPKKYRADKRKINNVDRHIDALTIEKNIHERMNRTNLE